MAPVAPQTATRRRSTSRSPLVRRAFATLRRTHTFFDNPFPPAGWTVTNTSIGSYRPRPPARLDQHQPWRPRQSDRRHRTLRHCRQRPLRLSGSTLDTIDVHRHPRHHRTDQSRRFRFNTDYDDLTAGGTTDSAILEASTDGGATWTTRPNLGRRRTAARC